MDCYCSKQGITVAPFLGLCCTGKRVFMRIYNTWLSSILLVSLMQVLRVCVAGGIDYN